MIFGYNTNGFAHHRLDDAIAILADLGYRGVAITVDHHAVNPFEANWRAEAERVRRLLEKHRLRSVIETGSRFLLDPRRKHQPTLISPDAAGRAVRVDFLRKCVELTHLLGADAVSFWSGTATDADDPWPRLIDGCRAVLDTAHQHDVKIAFEPEPGMFIDTMARYAELRRRLDASNFGLTLDIGHLHCLGETPIADRIHEWRDVLWNVHIEDMRRGVHDHVFFGEGEIDFPPVLRALHDISYGGGVYVELSRHSHDAVQTASRSLAFLRTWEIPAS